MDSMIMTIAMTITLILFDDADFVFAALRPLDWTDLKDHLERQTGAAARLGPLC